MPWWVWLLIALGGIVVVAVIATVLGTWLRVRSQALETIDIITQEIHADRFDF